MDQESSQEVTKTPVLDRKDEKHGCVLINRKFFFLPLIHSFFLSLSSLLEIHKVLNIINIFSVCLFFSLSFILSFLLSDMLGFA